MKLVRTRKMQGFSILAIILVIVAIVVAIGVWALSGQTNTSSQSGNVDIQASALINDSSSIQSRFDQLIISGANPDNIIFKPNISDANNVFDTSTGISVLKPSATALRVDVAFPEGAYIYNKAVKGNQIGTDKLDYAIVVAGVKTSVCKRLNYSIYGSDAIPVVASLPDAAHFVAGASATDPSSSVAIDLTAIDAVVGWTKGCLASASSDSDQNIYFRIVKPN